MYNGGFFRGKSFADGHDNECFFAIVWGTLIADPKVQMFNQRKTSFTVKYHEKAFINVVLWGESEAATVASVLEKGDMVICCGTVTKKKYTVRKGAESGMEKVWTDLNPQIIIPMPSIEFLIAAHTSDALNKIIDSGESSKASDAFESADDYDDEEQEEFEVTI